MEPYEAVYDVSHIYFLQKPIREEALKKALDIAEKRLLETKESRFCVEKIKSLLKDGFTMTDGSFVPISRSHRSNALRNFAKYTNRMVP